MKNKSQERIWITTKEAAERLGFHEGTLKNWRCQGIGPKYTQIGRSVRYRVADLDKFMNQGENQNAA